MPKFAVIVYHNLCFLAMKFLFFYLLVPFLIVAQNDYPKDYFASPLDIPLHLSGTFGELRSNHFHGGLDFKTQQKEGLNVYAAAEGYVSRIKISTFGNGKSIYITHPNGYTTVYLHLKKASDKIEKFIREIHHKEESYEIDILLNPGDIAIEKREIIALSGNTGGSGGPHLHFEIRDSKTQSIINPMLFGFDKLITDTKPPILTHIIAYPIGNSKVNQSQQPLMITFTKQADGNYLAEKVLVDGKVGFGIGGYDIFDYNYNKNGLYQVESFLNGQSHFNIQFDKFDFHETRYINAFIDFERNKKTGVKIQQLFFENPYPLSLLKTGSHQGIIEVSPSLNNTYRIVLTDFNHNKITVNIPIQYSNLPANINKIEKTTNYFLNSKTDNIYKKNNATVFFPEGTFYKDFYLNFDAENDTIQLHDDSVPVHNYFTVSLEVQKLPTSDLEKTFLATKVGKRIFYNKTTLKDQTFTTSTRNLGVYYLEKDTIAPKISPINFVEGKWMSTQNNIQFKISDDLSGIKSYMGYINNRWILFEYDYKTNTIIHEFESAQLLEGKNEFKLIVIDNVGNSTIFESHFFRSQK